MGKQNSVSLETGNLNRRSFLRLSGLLGVGLATGAMVPLTAEAVRFNRKMYKVSRTRLSMGTFVSMTLLHPSRDKAEEAMGLAFDEIDRLAGLMNRFKTATAVGELNREGMLNNPPPEVLSVVRDALAFYRVSKGAFDISVAPIVDLFKERLGSGNKISPPEAEIQKLLTRVDAGSIIIDEKTIRFRKPGMAITLDGIAKGYIVDRAAKLLANNNIDNFLINAGGDIRTKGGRQDRKPWTIAIQDPQKKKKYPDIIRISDGAIATSGNYEVYFDREKMFHHIVNPRTGLSPHADASVSVMAPTTMEADALSTSVFVMDPAEGIQFIDSLPRYECLILSATGTMKKSRGWKSAAI
ncbi:MAG: FAD:protein FMN transferase [Deltaproteobacteria bacterium]|nr:FAD:protein FMN transferase [Deltaproteobacteria bacterium]